VAGVKGLEPLTPGFGDRCSGQLSYTPIRDGMARQVAIYRRPGDRLIAASDALSS
jgi:hypothetical protein